MWDVHTMCVNSRNQVYVRGEVEDKGYYIRWYDRNNASLIKDIKCQCQNDTVLNRCLYEHPVNPDSIIETCDDCRKIRSYNMNTGESADIYTRAAVTAICASPAGSILGADDKGPIM